MSDHIPDATKMISDTPRTDDAEYLSYDSEPPQSLEMVDVGFARQLERELNAANDRIRRLEEDLMDAKNRYAVLVADVVLYEDRGERIKRLEEAGDAMVSHAKALGMDGTGLVKRWLKAKEAKL